MEDKLKKLEGEIAKGHLILPKDNMFKDAKSMLDYIITSMQFWVDENDNTQLAFSAMREISNLMLSTNRKFKNILLVVNLGEGRRKDFVDTNLLWLSNTKDPRKYSKNVKRKIIEAIKMRLEV